ncbi:DUF2170 family protein [Zooshikella marina]|uniref:DUF2170 family protein n=1 Tax=Zooshikella ganghwensis TaxID=202772 RepID=UPI001BAE8C7D|nr:DUF2170 family protein [Zooshikella ganghwensis]MBU2707768.1 DUF2170 family protein [Zooshikella ganghwensis]
MAWTLNDVQKLLAEDPRWDVTQEEDVIKVKNEEEIEAFLTVSGEQILVESLLFPAAQVNDTNELNKTILETHKLFPLTTISLETINGEQYYSAFGALSASSKADSIVLEIELLFTNVEGMLESYEHFLK